MNNQDKNTYVKQKITETLLELLKNRELSDINIGELTAIAQVAGILSTETIPTRKTL